MTFFFDQTMKVIGTAVAVAIGVVAGRLVIDLIYFVAN